MKNTITQGIALVTVLALSAVFVAADQPQRSDRSPAPQHLIRLGIDPTSSVIQVLPTTSRDVINSSFDFVSAVCLDCTGSCPSFDRSIQVTLQANTDIDAGYGVTLLTSSNYSVPPTGAVAYSTQAALTAGQQITVTITGAVLNCGVTFKLFFSMCDSEPADPADACPPTGPPSACLGGADLLSTAPGGEMVLCDDPANITCEQDFGLLCPTDWHLCTPEEYNNRNDGWTYPVPASRAVGVIFCRSGSGAGHFTITYASPPAATLGEDEVLNCAFGSSAPSCTTTYGCNEQSAQALCCAPTAACGNGVVDGPEELCDDGNSDESDDCLSTCTWRVPADHGLSGIGC